jgi:hypothetical protein
MKNRYLENDCHSEIINAEDLLRYRDNLGFKKFFNSNSNFYKISKNLKDLTFYWMNLIWNK